MLIDLDIKNKKIEVKNVNDLISKDDLLSSVDLSAKLLFALVSEGKKQFENDLVKLDQLHYIKLNILELLNNLKLGDKA